MKLGNEMLWFPFPLYIQAPKTEARVTATILEKRNAFTSFF